MSSRGTKLWHVPIGGTDGGWWFGYFGADDEWTENGPYLSKRAAVDALDLELEELFYELEGEL